MQEWTDIRRKVLVDGATKRSVMIEYAIGYRTLEKILSCPEPPGYRQTGAREKTKIGRFTGVIEHEFCSTSEFTFHYTTVAFSLIVAITAGLESLFHLGDKWRHYRANVESLKTEGWLFSLKSGPYRRQKTQAEAFQSFAERIEELLQRDVSEYLETVKGSSEEHSSVMHLG